MSKDINLLGKTTLQDQSKFGIIIRSVAIGLLSIVAFLAVLFFFLRSQSALSDLQTEESALIAQLSDMKVKTAKFLFIRDRMATAQTLITTRPNLDTSLSLLKRDIAEGLTITRMRLAKSEFSITVESSSLQPLHAYTEKFEKEISKEKLFKSVTIDNVSFDRKNAKYTVTIQGLLQ